MLCPEPGTASAPGGWCLLTSDVPHTPLVATCWRAGRTEWSDTVWLGGSGAWRLRGPALTEKSFETRHKQATEPVQSLLLSLCARG